MSRTAMCGAVALVCLTALTSIGPLYADPPDLKPTGANLGSLFPQLDKLAHGNEPAYSFLGKRFKTLDDFKAAAREKVFDLLLYRPEKVDPKPEVVERVDCGAYVRE